MEFGLWKTATAVMKPDRLLLLLLLYHRRCHHQHTHTHTHMLVIGILFKHKTLLYDKIADPGRLTV